MPAFTRLVRFEDDSGSPFYGELGLGATADHANLIGRDVQMFTGKSPWDDALTLTSEKRTIAKVLSPIEKTPLFMCAGLNYMAHANEAGLACPQHPVVFIKPADALAGPYDSIRVNKECTQLDYEAELCVVIGKDCKDVRSDEDAWSYVLGYTAGNDVTSRFWQAPAQSGGQHGSGKWFDGFAPIGPTIVARDAIGDVTKLGLRAIVNGKQRQSSSTGDLIFDIPSLIQHMSRGLTLRAGTVIMTGTPSGVGYFQKPPLWLQTGDIVDVEIDKIGKMSNRVEHYG